MPPKTISQVDQNEEANYLKTYFASRDGISDGIDVLRQRQLMPDTTREERLGISAEILRQEAILAKLTNKRRAFQAGTHTINPPTDGQVKAIQDLATRLDKLTANAQALRGAVDLTTEIANEFGKIQDEPR